MTEKEDSLASRRRFIGTAGAIAATALLASTVGSGADAVSEDPEKLLKQAAREDSKALTTADTQKLCECWKGCRPLFLELKKNKNGGNYQTLINSALRNCVREVTSEIAEARAGYGREFVIDEFGPMTALARARWARAKGKPGRIRLGKGAKAISVSIEREVLSRSDSLAKELGVTRAGLIERGLKAVLAAQGRE
jgi:hypothetical protein